MYSASSISLTDLVSKRPILKAKRLRKNRVHERLVYPNAFLSKCGLANAASEFFTEEKRHEKTGLKTLTISVTLIYHL